MNFRVILDKGAYMPERAHAEDAGADLRSPIKVRIPARGSAVIDTGVHIEIPSGYAGFLKSKSGLNVKASLLNEGVIDAGYTGSIVVKLYNHSDDDYIFEAGDKISQIVIEKVELPGFEQVESFETDTARGDGGFGSTGK
jgi:dUTP pyrophosphatase